MKIIKTQGLTFILFIVILTILLSCCGVPDGNCSCSETCGNNTTSPVSSYKGILLMIASIPFYIVYYKIIIKLVREETPETSNFTTFLIILVSIIGIFVQFFIVYFIDGLSLDFTQSNSRSATYNERIVEEEYNRPPETSDTTKTWTAIEEVYDASGKVKKRIYKY